MEKRTLYQPYKTSVTFFNFDCVHEVLSLFFKRGQQILIIYVIVSVDSMVNAFKEWFTCKVLVFHSKQTI